MICPKVSVFAILILIVEKNSNNDDNNSDYTDSDGGGTGDAYTRAVEHSCCVKYAERII